MKHLLVLLGISAGLMTAGLAQTANDTPRPVSPLKGSAKAKQDAAVARAVRNHRAVYYITTQTFTGSHIPQVVTRYEGHNTSDSCFRTGATYGAGDIALSGSLNVGAALNSLDPAISIR